jgi:HK97 family phage prohead protease
LLHFLLVLVQHAPKIKSVETKTVGLELKDLDSTKRVAVIKHAVYNSIDLASDISHKGMFDKTWKETKAAGIGFYLNHDGKHKLGKVTNVYDDNTGAYTEVKFGTWTEANDVLEQASEGILEGASFGYIAQKKDFSQIKGRRVRNLREVTHSETSLLQVKACHPEAGIVMLNKSFEALGSELKMLTDNELNTLKVVLANDMTNIQSLIALASSIDTNSDLYSGIMYMISRRADFTSSIMDQLRWNARQIADMKSYTVKMDNYLFKANASDEAIIMLSEKNKEIKQFIAEYNTANTQYSTLEPGASIGEKELLEQLKQFTNTLKN